MLKNSAQARRASKSRNKSPEPVPLVSPIFNGIEKPITTAEVASRLKVTERTIATYRQKRIIPFMRVTARRILYRWSDIERVLSLKNF
jgi:helix-turn-helix protein